MVSDDDSVNTDKYLYNCVYRFLDCNNNIIYIGKAKDLYSRMNSHGHLPSECYKQTKRVECCQFSSEYEMDLAERYFIPKINPKYNTVLNNLSINFSIEEFDKKQWNVYLDGDELEKKFLSKYNH